MRTLDVTIVGMGTCGVAAFAEAVARLRYERDTRVSFQLIERDDPARGLAFGTDQPGHRLNTESRLMGLYDHEAGDYRRWLEAREALEPDSVVYARRSEYRRYLNHVLDRALADAQDAGIAVTQHRDEAVRIDGNPVRATVALAGGGQVATNVVLLAIGTPQAERFGDLDGKPGYFDFPWPSERLAKGIARDASVTILGSSLSAIDTLMTLLDEGHEGPVLMASRDGMLPRVEIPSPENGYERRHLTLEAIHRRLRTRGRCFSVVDLVRLFRREVEDLVGHAVDWRKVDRRGGDAAAGLREDIDAALSGDEPFQRILTAARHDATAIWNLLRPLDRKRFGKWVGPHFATMRFVMPMVNAERIRAAFDRGQLQVRGGVVDTSAREGGGFRTTFENGEDHDAPVVVNATGTAMTLEEMREPLIADLLRREWLMPHPVGGARAHRGSGRIMTRDPASPRLYGVGQLLNGELRDTNSVWFNVETAARAVDDILHLR